MRRQFESVHLSELDSVRGSGTLVPRPVRADGDSDLESLRGELPWE